MCAACQHAVSAAVRHTSKIRHVVFAGPLILWRTDGLLIAFPVVAYGFTAHQFLFNIYATLRVPSVKRMVGVVQNVRVTMSCYCACLSCGLKTAPLVAS